MRRSPDLAVNLTLFVNVYAAMAGFVIVTALGRPALPAVLSTAALLGSLGALAFAAVLIGAKPESMPRPRWQAWLVRRAITIPEMLLLLGCVVVDIGLVLVLLLFSLPLSLLPPPACPCFP